MTDRSRVLQNILAMSVMTGSMPIGLGVPREALLLPDDDLPLGHPLTRLRMGSLTEERPLLLESPFGRADIAAAKKPARSTADHARRSKRKAERRARKRR